MSEIAEEAVLQLSSSAQAVGVTTAAAATTMGVLWAMSLSRVLNDTMQALIPAIYPVLKGAPLLSHPLL